MPNPDNIIEKRLFTTVLLIVVLIAGFYLRFDNLDHWLNNKNQYFTSTGLPVTLGVDPYYYIDIADDLLHGKIKSFDEYRHVPIGTHKPLAVPLLSVLLTLIAFLSNQSLEWVAVLLPPFLGIMLAFPVYLLGQTLFMDARIPWKSTRHVTLIEAKIAGLSAALIALMSPPFVLRSSVGWCDTDALNVVFTTLCAYWAVCFYCAENNKKRLRVFILWGVSTLFFLWWWDQVILPPLALAVSPMFLASIFKRTEIRKILPSLFYIFSAFLLILIVWKGTALMHIPDQFFSLFSYIRGSENNSFFPALEKIVQEQDNQTFSVLAKHVAGNIELYVTSLLGLVVLLVMTGKKFLLLFPFLILNILAFSAMRFLIFLAPLFGLGMGAVVLAILLGLRKFRYIRLAVIVPLICLFCRPPATLSQHYNTAKPLLSPVVYEGMKEIAAKTPKNSVVWSSWGHGHPLVYYAKRKTLGDGMYHPSFLDFVTKYPFATDNFRLAANWMQFYTAHGEEGMAKAFARLAGDRNDWANGVSRLKDLFAAGIEQSRIIVGSTYKMQPDEAERFLSFLFPDDSPPLYVFMDYNLIFENWYEIGKWDLKTRSEPPGHILIPVYDFYQSSSRIGGITKNGGFEVNLRTGVCFMNNGQRFILKGINIHQNSKNFVRNFAERAAGYSLYLTQNAKDNNIPSGVIADHYINDTLMIQLFSSRKFDQNFFTPVIVHLPSYLVCKVHGEKYSAQMKTTQK